MNISWLGHATFEFEFDGGEVLLLDPWMSNSKFPQGHALERLDAIALTHAHQDHVGDVIPLAKKFSPKVVAIFELAGILEKKGVANTIGMGKGGTVDLGFAKLTAVNAFHSSSYQEGDQMLYAGEPCGFILKSSAAPTVYCAGDTCVFGDMALIAEIYQPQIAILPIGGHFTMDPHEAAHAARLLKVKTVIPEHYGTFPVLTGSPDEVQRRLAKDGIDVLTLTAGKPHALRAAAVSA